MLDRPEVLAGVTERPRFLPWEFDTLPKGFKGGGDRGWGCGGLCFTGKKKRKVEMKKKGRNGPKRYFHRLLGAFSTQKLYEINNTQDIRLW